MGKKRQKANLLKQKLRKKAARRRLVKLKGIARQTAKALEAEAQAQKISDALNESHTLREEPEVKEIYFDTIECQKALDDVASEHPIEQNVMAIAGAETKKEIYFQWRSVALQRLLTPETKNTIMTKLFELIERLKGDESETAKKKVEMAVITRAALESELPPDNISLLNLIFAETWDKIRSESAKTEEGEKGKESLIIVPNMDAVTQKAALSRQAEIMKEINQKLQEEKK